MKEEPRKPGRPPTPQSKKRRKENFTLSPNALHLIEIESDSTGESKSGVVEKCIRRVLEKKHAFALIPKIVQDIHPDFMNERDDKRPLTFELPFLGAVAAGRPLDATLTGETLPVGKKYPAGHFIVEISGDSGKPTFHDGERWIIDGRDCFTPKQGKPCIVSDESGSYLKKWNRKLGVFESINPEHADVSPGEAAKLQGYPVEKLV